MTRAAVLARSTRTELARAARRQEILGGARRVFAARGFRGTTIADIADEAHIALGTIYLYFASKEAVFAALSEQLNELIAAALTDIPAAVSLEKTVRRRVENVFAICARNRDLIRLVVLNTDPDSDVTRRMRSAHEARVKPMVAEIARNMDNGVIRSGDACVMTRLVTGLVSTAVYQAFVLSDGQDAEKYAMGCADMIAAYLKPEV